LLGALTVLAALLSLIFILDYTKYPDAQRQLLIFHYLLREQDLAGNALIIAIAVGACLPRTRSAVLELIDGLARHPWPVAGASFVVLCAATLAVAHNHPLAGDEHLAVFQSRVFAAGHLAGQFPRDLLSLLIPPHYQGRWLIASDASGAVASVYWPGFALLLAPFSLIGAPWACNPLLASLSLVLIAKLAARLTGNARAGGWAMLFALGSPAFTGMALSYFSMSAHLCLNLLFAWLVLKGGTRPLVAAGVVGSFALVLSNPVPHALFALPWILWIARRPGSRRDVLALAAGYAPLALLLGLGWWLFLRALQGPLFVVPYPEDGDALHRAANLLSYLLYELGNAFSLLDGETILRRLSEQVRLWSWAVPGLPLLALAGWWLHRGVTGLRLLAWSLLATLLGYLFVSFDQGYGWGARYVHPAWGALPILAASAMVSLRDDAGGARLAGYVARMALLSLVFATALRFFQIHLFMDEQLALRPPFEKGARQVVFVTPIFEYYLQDFVQNDPFLRDPVIFVTSRGFQRDYTYVIQRRFPGARLTYIGREGHVWRLD
jgi:hypothetical protein